MTQNLAPLMPTGNRLIVFFWQRQPGGKKMHPRYILTELGGLQPDFGLDEGDAPGDTTEVALLGETIWEKTRGDYCATGETFKGDPSWRVNVNGAG
jgi:hypothetical protein